MDIFIDSQFRPTYERHPLVLVDVGARGGLRKNWQSARPHLRYIGFEPEAEEFNRLGASGASPDTTVFNVALHHRRERLMLYVARQGGLSSIFEPDRAFLDRFPEAGRFDVVQRLEVEANSLDDQLAAHGIDDVDFIKIDTQGSELFVLRGASRALASSLVGVEVEVSFSAMYKGQPYFADVDTHLRSAGYRLFDLRPCYWKRKDGQSLGGPRGQIVWADALYLKDLPALQTTVSGRTGEAARAKALKAISVALIYGYADLALELANDPGIGLSGADADLITRRLRAAWAAGRRSNFPGRRTVAAALHRLWRLCRPSAEAWSISRAEIGNLE